MDQLITWILCVSVQIGVHNNTPGVITLNLSDKSVNIFYELNYLNTRSNDYHVMFVRKEANNMYIIAENKANKIYRVMLTITPDYVVLADMSRHTSVNNGPDELVSAVYYRNKNAIKRLPLTEVSSVIDEGFRVLNRQ